MGRIKDPNAPANMPAPPAIDWGKQVEAFGEQLKVSVAEADKFAAQLFIPNSGAMTKDPDTGQFWDGVYPDNLCRLEPETLNKYLQMSVSEISRFSRLMTDLSFDVDNAGERIEYIKDALAGTVPGGNAEQRKTNTTTNPQLIKEKLARVYYKRIYERAKFGYKYHSEHRDLIDSLLNNKYRDRYRTNELGNVQNRGYVSPFTRQYQPQPQQNQLGAPYGPPGPGPKQPG
jgi:hypothetical protein